LQIDYANFYRSLYRIRRVEEETARIYPTDRIKSPVHLSIGQEAAAVGVCEALRPDDVVFGTYRGHALYLAKGGDLNRMMAELYGKTTGCTGGKGGSMHLIDPDHGVMGTSAVVSTTIPHAAGYAYAARLQGRDTVVASFFGDGAVDEGVFFETLTFAGLKRLPVIFVCENNLYAIHSHHLDRHPQDDLCGRARSLGLEADRVEANDVFALHERATEAVEAIRSGEGGPAFIEVMTYRWKQHVGPGDDFHLGYRSEEEARQWIDSDQLPRVGSHLEPGARARIEAEVEDEIRSAIRFAENSPFPEPRELWTDVFAES